MKVTLNPEQLDMVNADGNILVTACPGSGKTRALTYRIARELGKITEKKQYVVALTYTNRAADEIQNRIDNMNIDTHQLWTGTIHSFCLEWILRPYAGYIERLKNGFSVIDEFRQEQMLKQIKLEHGLPAKSNISIKWGRNGRQPMDFPILHKVADQYDQLLQENKWIDFDLILYLSYVLLNEKPQIGNTLSRLFSTMCIDEFQDTSDLQYGIIGKIIKAGQGHTCIVFVGDPDQAVYESLGGMAKTAQEISVEIGGYSVQQMQLSGNYRSTQRIIDYYRHFQINDLDIRALGEGMLASSVITLNDRVYHDNLPEEIARLIQWSLDQGIPQHEICVIAPQWWMLISMARNLKRLLPDVDFDAPGLSPLPKRPENFWYKVARLFLTDPSPRLFYSRIRWANEILHELRTFLGKNLFTADGTQWNARLLLKITNSITLSGLTSQSGVAYLKECFQHILRRLDIAMEAHTQLQDHYNAFFESIDNRIRRTEFTGANHDVESFKGVFKHSQGVVVNTCQGVKGEEYETVIAYGLLDGYIPHASIDRTVAPLASKRLLYVICSRAKTNLHLIAEIGRRHTINNELREVHFNYDVL